MGCFRNKHVDIDDGLVNPPNVPVVEGRVKRRPSKIPVRVVKPADVGAVIPNPPLVNALADNGKPKVVKKVAKEREPKNASLDASQVKKPWNGSTRVPEHWEHNFIRPMGGYTGGHSVPIVNGALACDHLRVPITPPKPVGTALGRRSSVGSLIPVRVPTSRFSASTVNDASVKQSGKNKISFKPVKSFFKRVGRRLAGKDKKEKKAIIDALSAPIESLAEKAPSVVVEVHVENDIPALIRTVPTARIRDGPSVVQDQAPTKVSAYRDAAQYGFVDKRREEASGNRANGYNDKVEVAPVSKRPAPFRPPTVLKPTVAQRESTTSMSISTSSSSEIQVPTDLDLQAMADAFRITNKPATTLAKTNRRRTACISPSVSQKAAVQPEVPMVPTNSPPVSTSSCSSVEVPTDSQLQAMEALLCASKPAAKPVPARRSQFTRRGGSVEITTPTEPVPSVPVLVIQSPSEPVLEEQRVVPEEPASPATVSEESVAPTAESVPAVIEPATDNASTASSDIVVPSDSQMQLFENLLCGSNKSDSGVDLVAQDEAPAAIPQSISTSSSDFLVPSDSQMQLYEDLLCEKTLTGPAPLAKIVEAESVPVVEEVTEAIAQTPKFDIPEIHVTEASLSSGNADTVSVESSDIAVPTDAELAAMERSLCGANADATTEVVSSDSDAALSPVLEGDSDSLASSEIIVPSDSDFRAMELALTSTGRTGFTSTEEEASSDTDSSSNSNNSSPLIPAASTSVDHFTIVSRAGKAATSRRSVNRSLRQLEGRDAQPKRSAMRKETEIVEVDRLTDLPVKSNWREVHFPEKDLAQVAIIPREPETVDMSYIVPDPDPVQMTADRVFLNTACLMDRTDVPGMRLDRVFPILDISSPRPDQGSATFRRFSPRDLKGSLLREPKADSPPSGEPRRSPWKNHNRFFDYEARVKSDPYTLGQHKELVLWRNRHRLTRRTSVHLPGVPFIISDSANVLKRASDALGEHICKLGLNQPRELPMQAPVRSEIVHNAHFLRHTEAEDCPCGKSRKSRRLSALFTATNVSAFALTEVSYYQENGLRDPDSESESDYGSDDSEYDEKLARRQARATQAADSLLTCGAYRARQMTHPLITEYSHLYDLVPRRGYIPSASTSTAPGTVSVLCSGSVPLENDPASQDLSLSGPVVPQLIVTSPSSLSPAVSASSVGSVTYGLHPTRSWTSTSQLSLCASSSVNSLASSHSVSSQSLAQKSSSVDRLFTTSHGTPAVANSDDLDTAPQKASGKPLRHIIELSSDVLQEPRPSGYANVSSVSPRVSATSKPARQLVASGPTSESVSTAARSSSRTVNSQSTRNKSTLSNSSSSVPFLRSVRSRVFLLPRPSLDDLGYHRT